MPPPRPATEERSDSLEPGPISQYAPSSRLVAHAARRPDVRDRRQTDRRQTASSLNAPPGGGIKSLYIAMLLVYSLSYSTGRRTIK